MDRKTIHDLPPELLSLTFRLGSEDLPYNSTHENTFNRFVLPKRFPDDRRYVIKLFARLMSEVCSSWRKLVLSDRDLRLVIIGSIYTIKGLWPSARTFDGWKKILDETGQCDVQLFVSPASHSETSIGDLLSFIENNARRLISLRLQSYGAQHQSEHKLIISATNNFPRLQHLDIAFEAHYTTTVAIDGGSQGFALDASKFPSLKHLTIEAPRSSWNSFSSDNEAIIYLISLDICSLGGGADDNRGSFLAGLIDVLRANVRLQVLVLRQRRHQIFLHQVEVGNLAGAVVLESLESLTLLLTMEGICQFLTACSTPTLKRLVLSALSTTAIDERLDSIHLPCLESLVFTPDDNDQAKLISRMQVSRLVSFAYHSSDRGSCAAFALSATRLQKIEVSGQASQVNTCLLSLPQLKHPTITFATIKVSGDSKDLLKDVDQNLFSHVKKLKFGITDIHLPTIARLYSYLTNLRELELLPPRGRTTTRLPNELFPAAEDKNMVLPKLEAVKCHRRSYYSHDGPLSYSDCSRLFALAEGRAKSGRRLKLISLDLPLAMRTRSRLENVVDRVDAPQGRRQ